MKVYDEKNDRFIFIPNLIVFQSENGEERVFAGEKCKKEFCEFLYSLVESEEYFTIIGHNSARFDTFFIFFILQVICDEGCDDPTFSLMGRFL